MHAGTSSGGWCNKEMAARLHEADSRSGNRTILHVFVYTGPAAQTAAARMAPLRMALLMRGERRCSCHGSWWALHMASGWMLV